MIVRAADLRPEGLRIDRELEIGPLTDEAGLEIGVTRAQFAARVAPAGGGLRCAGELAADIRVPCARCLEAFPLSIQRAFDLEYRNPTAAAGTEPEVQVPRGDLDLAWLDEKGCLDVDGLAGELIYLELPMKPLCSPDCRGLCIRCGANLNRGACPCAPVAQTGAGGTF